MIHLILNQDNTIRNALHESCGEPEEHHVTVEDAVWAPLSGYPHEQIHYENGMLRVEDGAVYAASNVRIKGAIAKLEAGQLRAVREAMITGDLTRLKAIDNKIAELRKELR